MDRRTLFSTLQPKKQAEDTMTMSPPAGLTPYAGTWGFEQAAHLLRRGMFGPSYTQMKWATQAGLNATVEKLLEDLPLPSPPVNVDYRNDSYVPIGSTWIEARYSNNNTGDEMAYRERSLRAWTLGNIIQEGVSIREKMVLFWHNHFPINEILDPKYQYRYSTTLRQYALDNFRELVKAITVDPAMLMYLNGNLNSKFAPNENFARELLELFTIGKGPLVGPGDYSNYTEQDVKEIARVLTGWRDYGFTTASRDGKIGSTLDFFEHDTGTKTLSHRFDNKIVTNKGVQEYKVLINIIFQNPEVARFICRKIYRWFVYYVIDAEIEQNVIEPMAQILVQNDYRIKPVLKALLTSQHFFDSTFVGAMIKNPMDFAMSILKPLVQNYPTDLKKKYYAWYATEKYFSRMQMDYYYIPEVAGWKAYYQSPLYYRIWINASTLPARLELASNLAEDGIFPFDGEPIYADVLSFIAQFDDPYTVDGVVDEFAKVLLPVPLSDAQREALKQVFLQGTPAYEWSKVYSDYLDNPNRTSYIKPVDSKLRALLKAMLEMAEFYLS